MPARCYPCDQKVGPRPGAAATGDPHGACKICGALACDGHSVRNASYPRIECVVCIPVLAAASTAASSAAPGQLAQDLRRLLESLGGSEMVIRDVEDFLARYPDLRGLLDEVDALLGAEVSDSREAGRYYRELDREQRRLLLLAIVILRRLDVRPELLPDPVRRLYELWR